VGELCFYKAFAVIDAQGVDVLNWSEGAEPASGMRISCVRAGVGWESLSSVRHAGKVPKRAPK